MTFGCAAVGLFLLNSPTTRLTPDQQWTLTLRAIDQEVDSVLTSFGIRQDWIRKRQISLPAENFARTERRVAIPPGVYPVMVNAALNSMAHRHNGRAIATEDLRQNTVTIHIEVQKVLLQTIILKIDQNLKIGGLKSESTKV